MRLQSPTGVLRWILLAALLAGQAPGAGAQQATQAGVLQRWLDALGGRAAVESVQVTYVWARIEGRELRGRSEEWNTARGELRSVADFNTFRRTTGYDGRRGYVVDENRKVRELGGASLRTLRTEVYLSSGSPWFPSRVPGSIRYLGSERGGEQEFHVLEAQAEDGLPVRVYLDARTCLPARIRRIDDADTSWTLLSGYRPVDGVMEAFTLETRTGDRGETTRFLVEAVQHPREPFPPGFFAPPPDTLRDFAFAGGADSAEVPFEMWGDHMVALATSHGVTALPFLLDTGAEATNLEAALARRWRLAGEAPLQIQGTGGTEPGSLVALDTLALPGVSLLHQRVVAVDLSGVQPQGRRLAGVLGYDFFSRFVVRIDFGRKVMVLRDPAGRGDTAGPGAPGVPGAGSATTVPLLLDGFVPRVDVVVNDTLSARLQLDTGAPASVVFFRAFWAAHAVLPTEARHGVETSGLGGRTTSLEARFGSLSLGGLRLERPTGLFRESEAGATRSREDAGLLGMGFLRRFDLTLDYARRTLTLRPNAAFQEP